MVNVVNDDVLALLTRAINRLTEQVELLVLRLGEPTNGDEWFTSYDQEASQGHSLDREYEWRIEDFDC